MHSLVTFRMANLMCLTIRHSYFKWRKWPLVQHSFNLFTCHTTAPKQ
jgi:hypothetical protein